jgi:uncharacterized protein
MGRTRKQGRRRRVVIVGGAALGVVIAVGTSLWWWTPWWPPIEVTAPGPTGQRVMADSVFGNYYPAGRQAPGPAVLLLGGSEGGISKYITEDALALQAEGLSVLSLGYFGVPGQPKSLERVPLETFDRALSWLNARPEVDPQRVSVFGVSKGAEAALLVATRHPELRAVVAGSPSSVAWPGVNRHSVDPAASWTLGGRSIPVLPYGPLRPSLFLGHLDTLYRGGLKGLSRHPQAIIPVERIRGLVLLTCGEDDALWPSCEMAQQVQARAEGHDGPQVTVLAYRRAGHESVGVPLSPTSSEFGALSRWGGTRQGNNAARADGWPKIVELLRG